MFFHDAISPLWVIGLVVVIACIAWLRIGQHAKITVVVLGDIGLSPRMQYHSLSFADVGYSVDVVGYGGSIPHSRISQQDRIQLFCMPTPPDFSIIGVRLVTYFLKAVFQSIALFVCLLCRPKPRCLIVQNPPSIPALPICWFICRLRGSRFLIDWHNYGHTRLALSLQNKKHFLVVITKSIEAVFGRWSDGGLCVSQVMKSDLNDKYNIRATVHYDRPPDIFLQPDLTTQHQLFVKLAQKYDLFKPRSSNSMTSKTAFTRQFQDGNIEELDDRPALVVSSTSWSDDEDFNILIQAFEEYEDACCKGMSQLPNITCVITGKGPLKEHYIGLLALKHWKHVQVCTPWLEANDYPVMLGSADLGVCLHTSSSGIDLPMKVVDMFGVGLPVCALGFQALPELVQHNKNGLIFHCARELAQQLQDIFKGFPRDRSKLVAWKKNLENFERWHEEWTTTVLPLCA